MDINKLEIEGRLDLYSKDWDAVASNSNKKPTASDFTSRIEDKLNIILCYEYKQERADFEIYFGYMHAKALAFLQVAETLRPQFGNCLQILTYSCFLGSDESYQYFVDSMNVIAKYEKEHASVRNYQYYKCLCKIWGGNLGAAMTILDKNASQKGNKRFYLPSSEAALRAMLDHDEASFIELIEVMRDEYAKKHRNINFLNQSLAKGVVACPAMALLKVSEKYFGKNIAKKIKSKTHTFKYWPRCVDDVDATVVRGEFTIDHMFPLKFWPCNQTQ